MSMTARDYTAVSSAIREHAPAVPEIVEALCTAFAENPRFDPERFRRDCGMKRQAGGASTADEVRS